MRLIDIDDWKNKNEIFFGLGLEFDIDRVVETLNQMPTVDAIPIEWIENYAKENYPIWDRHAPIRAFYTNMIKVWRKENE